MNVWGKTMLLEEIYNNTWEGLTNGETVDIQKAVLHGCMLSTLLIMMYTLDEKYADHNCVEKTNFLLRRGWRRSTEFVQLTGRQRRHTTGLGIARGRWLSSERQVIASFPGYLLMREVPLRRSFGALEATPYLGALRGHPRCLAAAIVFPSRFSCSR